MKLEDLLSGAIGFICAALCIAASKSETNEHIIQQNIENNKSIQSNI